MIQLGITISQKKLVETTMKTVCLSILIDTVQVAVSIPPDKWEGQKEWKAKNVHKTTITVTIRYIVICLQMCKTG